MFGTESRYPLLCKIVNDVSSLKRGDIIIRGDRMVIHRTLLWETGASLPFCTVSVSWQMNKDLFWAFQFDSFSRGILWEGKGPPSSQDPPLYSCSCLFLMYLHCIQFCCWNTSYMVCDTLFLSATCIDCTSRWWEHVLKIPVQRDRVLLPLIAFFYLQCD